MPLEDLAAAFLGSKVAGIVPEAFDLALATHSTATSGHFLPSIDHGLLDAVAHVGGISGKVKGTRVSSFLQDMQSPDTGPMKGKKKKADDTDSWLPAGPVRDVAHTISSFVRDLVYGDEIPPEKLVPTHFHVPIDDAWATSIYSSGTTAQGPRNAYGPKRALAPGSGYWCSSGHHGKDQVITWKGFLHKRKPLVGMKISWAYAPGMVRVRTTPDGLQWDEVVKWHHPLNHEVSFEEDMIFDRQRNVMQVRVDMKEPQDWGYFGINQATLMM